MVIIPIVVNKKAFSFDPETTVGFNLRVDIVAVALKKPYVDHK